MVNKEIVRKRVSILDEYLIILYKLQAYRFDDFAANPEHYGSAERFLHLAIEAINDTGNHIIADEGYGMVDSYRDIPTLLHENGVIDAQMRDMWIRMIGFRNILVHQYIEIDRRIVYRTLQENLGDIEAIVKVFAGYL